MPRDTHTDVVVTAFHCTLCLVVADVVALSTIYIVVAYQVRETERYILDKLQNKTQDKFGENHFVESFIETGILRYKIQKPVYFASTNAHSIGLRCYNSSRWRFECRLLHLTHMRTQVHYTTPCHKF